MTVYRSREVCEYETQIQQEKIKSSVLRLEKEMLRVENIVLEDKISLLQYLLRKELKEEGVSPVPTLKSRILCGFFGKHLPEVEIDLEGIGKLRRGQLSRGVFVKHCKVACSRCGYLFKKFHEEFVFSKEVINLTVLLLQEFDRFVSRDDERSG